MSKTKISEFKVGNIIYEVVLDEDLMMDEQALGSCDYLNAEISLFPRQNEQRMEQVLHHELMHAIFSEAGYDEQDEDMVNRLGIVFHQFITDNFQFIGHTGIREQVAEIADEMMEEEEAVASSKRTHQQPVGFDTSHVSGVSES